MIEPHSTHVGRLVRAELPGNKTAIGPLQDFTAALVFFRGPQGPVEATRDQLEWDDIAQAKDAFRAAGLAFEVLDDHMIRIAGHLFDVRNGMFTRPDGRKGSGGPVALVRAIREGAAAESSGRDVEQVAGRG